MSRVHSNRRYWTAIMAATVACGCACAADIAVTVTSDDIQVLGDAIVYAVSRSPELRNALAKQAIKPVSVDQVGKEFAPLVSAVSTGTRVEFPNSDNIRHHVYSFSTPKIFDLKLYSGRPSTPVLFDKPGLVTLGCNIHDQMIAWLLVVDTPWIAKADAKGMAVLKGLTAGEYALHVWHPGINPSTNLDSVSEIIRVDSISLSKSIRIAATPVSKLRQRAVSSGSDNTIAPPRAGPN